MISIIALLYSMFFPFSPQIGPGLMGPGPGVKSYAAAGWVLKGSAKAESAGAVATLTISGMTCAGADFVAVSLSAFDLDLAALTVTSSPLKTFSQPVDSSSASYHSAFSYTYNAGLSGNLDLTVAMSGFGNMYAECWAGALTTGVPLDSSQLGNCGTATSCTPTALTPGQNNSLIISTFAHDEASGTVAASGMTIPANNSNLLVGGQHVGGGLAYLVQATAASFAPTWTVGGASGAKSATIAAFKPAP